MEEALSDLRGMVDLALDAGRTPIAQESTVVDFTQEPPRLLRVGAIVPERLREVVGEVRAK
jgi:L-threonylcarbamoyladenylate synthase